MGVLDTILATKRDEVTLLHQPATRAAIRRAALDAPAPRPFERALRRTDGRLAVIAEIKRRSPSKGLLAPGLDVARTAALYEEGGAAALSVLTDSVFFDGTAGDLGCARAACTLPVLRKDFVIDEVQVYETRALGADAILLIVAAIPDDALLADLRTLGVDLGLAVVVEAHDAAEVDRALGAGATIVGVNSRSLQTFDEDLGRAETAIPLVPAAVVAVAESGVRSAGDAARLAAAGFDAVLVGETLVKSQDPRNEVAAMSAATVSPRRTS